MGEGKGIYRNGKKLCEGKKKGKSFGSNPAINNSRNALLPLISSSFFLFFLLPFTPQSRVDLGPHLPEAALLSPPLPSAGHRHWHWHGILPFLGAFRDTPRRPREFASAVVLAILPAAPIA